MWLLMTTHSYSFIHCSREDKDRVGGPAYQLEQKRYDSFMFLLKTTKFKTESADYKLTSIRRVRGMLIGQRKKPILRFKMILNTRDPRCHRDRNNVRRVG